MRISMRVQTLTSRRVRPLRKQRQYFRVNHSCGEVLYILRDSTASLRINPLNEAVRIRNTFKHTPVEAIMSTISNYAVDLRGSAATKAVVWIGHVVQRCWKALQEWHDEQEAIARLATMTDRELRDIGLNRSEIGFAVRGQLEHLRRRAS